MALEYQLFCHLILTNFGANQVGKDMYVLDFWKGAFKRLPREKLKLYNYAQRDISILHTCLLVSMTNVYLHFQRAFNANYFPAACVPVAEHGNIEDYEVSSHGTGISEINNET